MTIRHYTLRLTTKGPVHIGNGKVLGKKDYFARGSSVAVLDVKEFVGKLNTQQLDQYVRFLSSSDFRTTLQDFLDQHQDIRRIAESSVAYTIDAKLARVKRGYLYHNVAEFVKDPYGNPYVPGSSVKGMLRTAILAAYLDAHRDECKRLYDARLTQAPDKKTLMCACSAIEHSIFFREHPDNNDPRTSNDIMRYVFVADSAPLSANDLVFAKKYDLFSKYDDGHHKKDLGRVSNEDYWKGNSLDVYRECIKPGVQIEFKLDIDDRIDSYLGTLDAEHLHRMLVKAQSLYETRFLEHFDCPAETSSATSEIAVDGRCQYIYESGSLQGARCRNRAIPGTPFCNTHQDCSAPTSKTGEQATCYLGGGAGFTSKTVVHALLASDSRRVEAIARTLYAQFPTKIDRDVHRELWIDVCRAEFVPQPMHASYKKSGALNKAKDDHRHWLDPWFGVSPHTAKLAIIGNQKYLMGACGITIEE